MTDESGPKLMLTVVFELNCALELETTKTVKKTTVTKPFPKNFISN